MLGALRNPKYFTWAQCAHLALKGNGSLTFNNGPYFRAKIVVLITQSSSRLYNYALNFMRRSIFQYIKCSPWSILHLHDYSSLILKKLLSLSIIWLNIASLKLAFH